MPLTFAETPLYYRDSQGQYHRVLSGADMTGYAKIDEENHRNLLDNWYFVGGGSQLGNGVFPINQRGQTSYSATGYKIDRWSLQRGSITLQDGGMLCTSPTDNTLRFEQRLPYGTLKDLLGKTCTLSALVNDTLCVFTTIVSEAELVQSFVVGGVSVSLYLNFISAWGNISRPVQFFVDSGKSVVLKAVKLELGSYQTLAHNEGTEQSPNWVLNEIPNYSDELNKCLMHFERLKGPYVGFATGYSTNTSNAYVCGKVNPKVKAPTITLSGTIYLQSVNHAGSDSSASTSLQSVYALPSGNFSFICQSSNMTQGEFNQAQFRDTTSYLDFSAE